MDPYGLRHTSFKLWGVVPLCHVLSDFGLILDVETESSRKKAVLGN